MGPVEKFGEFIVAHLRDSAIDIADDLLEERWKSPCTQELQFAVSRFSISEKDLIRRVVVASIDSGIHAFLFALSKTREANNAVSVFVGGQNVAALSDELHGETFSEEEWFAKFSKHGPQPAAA